MPEYVTHSITFMNFMPTPPLGPSSHHTTHRITVWVDIFSKIEIYESHSNNDRWWSNSTIDYIKMNTMSNQWRRRERGGRKNSMMKINWFLQLECTIWLLLAITRLLCFPPRNFRMILIELIWRAAAHSSICTIRKEHTTKTDMHA
jgi:hypothetical protein